MNAAVITTSGGPDVLEIRDVPRPAPSAEEVLVRVHASALNRADLLQRRGRYPAPPGSPADIPGIEFAGEIVELGAAVRSWRTGQRVFGLVGGGAQAEYLVTHARTIAEIPDGLSWTDAAAVPEAFITAHDALVTQAELRTSERVLIHAVASGVGLAAVQLVRAMSAIPYGTSRTPAKIDRTREYGIEDGLVLGGDLRPLMERAREWSNGDGMDIVLELVGGAYVSASLATLSTRGRLILIGTMAGASTELDLGVVLRNRLRIIGTALRSRPLEEKIAATRAFAAQVVPLLARGVVRPVVDSVFPLEEIRAAHERLESNETVGKVVVSGER
ncbi:MAG TPA: NAD(P)H-quinone oxidoreductase [Gemmatimonadaceae bacterium]|jgi:putative PIG3 family NAD(P)H quinone oxidoreductase|nr:NAD(P)H-quinone oxidoreductase [Gemmatimonadaceae bacterium]